MAIHKLNLGEFDEIDYHLIAIHTLVEDYRLAYFINQKLPIILEKSSIDIPVNNKEGETFFSRFSYFDTENEVNWELVQNKNEVKKIAEITTQNLFSNVAMEISTKVFLLPEFKKVDYFLKIENNECVNIADIQSTLNTIENVSTVYSIDTNQIKAKNNLIF